MVSGSPSDAIDGVVPRHIVEPQNETELGEALSTASRDRLATVLRGGGTKLAWGRVPVAIDRIVSTARLNQEIVHRHGDLTVTAQAGVTLRRLNEELARHGQWLPVESPFDDATVGGVVATNDAGPLRQRFGTPRDLLIGVRLAMPDGRLVKAGGHVVKNVAGYDLGKLISGSFGTLAAIAEVTFKLLPLPRASATLVAGYQDAERLGRDASLIAASQLEPLAFDVRVSPAGASDRAPFQLLVCVASSPAAVEAQIESARRLVSGDAVIVRDAAESAIWYEQLQRPWAGEGAVVRVGWLPARLPEVISLIEDVQQMAGGRVTMIGRGGVGAGLLTIDGDALSQSAVVGRLRSSVFVGNVSVLRASRELKAQLDVWCSPGNSLKAMQALKQAFDPAGILSAGRGPI